MQWACAWRDRCTAPAIVRRMGRNIGEGGSRWTRSRVLLVTLALLAGGCAGPPRADAEKRAGRADAGHDAGPVDAGRDASLDAAPDAPVDAEIDAGRDTSLARPRRPSVAPLAAPDEVARREVLAESEIVLVERGHGGRSLGFRLTFADGSRGYFKPEQTFSGTHWYAEIAAHHLDRALGLDRTPLVVGRSIAWATLEEAAADDPRVPEIVVGEDGKVRGAVIAWIEERLVPLRAPSGWERWIRLDPVPGITPFSRPRAWYRAIDVLDAGPRSDPAQEPDTDERAAELSDLVVFDYLVHNTDRWSENSTNVRTRGEHGPLVHLDQGAGFSPRRARLRLMDARLEATQRFRRSTIDSVRALDLDAYAASLARDPLAPILDPRQLAHLAERRAHLVEHVEALVSDRGEEQVYAW